MPAGLFSSILPGAHLVVRGADAATFLQGQFTNDLAHKYERACTYGLWLNQKGRVLADSFVVARGPEHFEVLSQSSSAEVIRPRLEAYVIADDVTIEDRTADSSGFVIAGSDAAQVLESVGFVASAVPAAGEYAEGEGGALLFRGRSAGVPSWVLVVAKPTVATWRERFQSAVSRGLAREATATELAAARIRAGIPEVPRELGPSDLPGEGGLEDEAISYTKGCYLGQEVMARLRNLGQVRRRLFVVRCRESAASFATTVPAQLFLGARAVGELRNLVDAGGGAVGLAMLQLNAVKSGASLATAPDGPPVVEVERPAEGRVW